MRMSESVKNLAEALNRAQKHIEGAPKTSENPYFKSKYADLSSVWEAAHEPLNDAGISVIQGVSGEGGASITVSTMLLHASGEFIETSGSIPIPPPTSKAMNVAQCAGLAISYMRRYQLAAMCMVMQEDSDGNMKFEGGGTPTGISETSHGIPSETPSETQPETSDETPQIISADIFMDKMRESKAKRHLINVWKKYAHCIPLYSEQDAEDCRTTKNKLKEAFDAVTQTASGPEQGELTGGIYDNGDPA